MKSEFRTLDGYDRVQKRALTRTMEDYLEMISRLSREDPVVRVQAVAENLNVKPSSVTKMMQQLAARGFIEYHPYAYLKLTAQGAEEGDYLLYRHGVLHAFLCLVNGSPEELEQVELIEHFFNRRTVENIEKLVKRLQEEKETDDNEGRGGSTPAPPEMGI